MVERKEKKGKAFTGRATALVSDMAIAYDAGLRTLVSKDKSLITFTTQKYIPYKIELEPWFHYIPKYYQYGRNYNFPFGFKFSCGIGVPYFSRITINGDTHTWRHETRSESGYEAIFNLNPPITQTMEVKIEVGRIVNGEYIVDVIYEGSTVTDERPGQGVGYPYKIVSWDSKPEIYGEDHHGYWFNFFQEPPCSEKIVYALRDLDSGTLLWKRTYEYSPGLRGLFYGYDLKPPSGERHLRVSIESVEGEVYDYFDMC